MHDSWPSIIRDSTSGRWLPDRVTHPNQKQLVNISLPRPCGAFSGDSLEGVQGSSLGLCPGLAQQIDNDRKNGKYLFLYWAKVFHCSSRKINSNTTSIPPKLSDLCDAGQKFAQAQGHFVDFPLAFQSIMWFLRSLCGNDLWLSYSHWE